MSLIDTFREEFVSQVYHLSQEEGMKDHEIAEKLGCSRATINRTRRKHDIPTADLGNRKDKVAVCHEHGTEYYIKRKERRKRKCPGFPTCSAVKSKE